MPPPQGGGPASASGFPPPIVPPWLQWTPTPTTEQVYFRTAGGSSTGAVSATAAVVTGPEVRASDFIIIALAWDNAGGSAFSSMSPTATQQGTTQSKGTISFALFTLTGVAAGTTITATTTVTTRAAIMYYAFSNPDPTTPLDVAVAFGLEGAVAVNTHAIPSLTTVTPNDVIVAFVADKGPPPSQSVTPGDGLALRNFTTSTVSASSSISVSDTHLLPVGTYGSFTVTNSLASTSAIMAAVAIRIPQPAAPTHGSLTLPLRGAFYYPWFTGGSVPGFPGAWDQGGVHPWTQYHPVRGYYDSSSTATIDAHIADLQYGKFDFAISSWWGQGSREDGVFPTLLARANALATGFQWCVYYEPEGNTVAGVPGSPSPASSQLTADLNYLTTNYTNDPSYLHIGGKPVIFVYGGAEDDSANTPTAANRPASRWSAAVTAATESWYYVLKVYDVWATDNATWPAPNWHQYGPAVATDQQGTHSFTLSPGFWVETEHTPRLVRDLPTFTANVRTMLASGADFKLVTSFNEFGEGHPVEAVDGPSGTTGDYAGTGWTSNTGFGQYLDALHTNGQAPGLLATTSFTGARTALTRTARTAIVGFTGTSNTLTRALRTSTVGFTDALNTFTRTLRTAALSFTGSLGTILTGGGNHFTQALSATLSFTGALPLRTSHQLTAAAVSFTGTLPRQSRPRLTGTVGFTGTLLRAIVHLFTAALAFTGVLAAGHLFSKILTAAVGFIGGAFGSAGGGGTPSLVAQTPGSGASSANQLITASATVGNKLVLVYARSGGLATGAVTGVTDTGGNSWSVVTRGAVSGSSNTRIEVWACDVIASPGTITVASGTAQTNSWTVLEYANVGAVDVASPDNSSAASSTTITTPSINSTGSNDLILAAAHFGQTTAPLSSSSPWAALTNFDDAAVGSGRAAHILGAAAGSYAATWSPLGTAKPAGIVTVSLLATGSGAGTTGRLIITTNKRITAGVGFTAAALSNAVRKLVTATISFSGNLATGGTNHFTQALNATISFTGAVPRFVTKTPIAATIGFTGTTLRRLTRSLTASINFTGALPRTLNRSLAATVSFTGALSRAPSRLLAASISFTGANTRRTNALRSGALSFTGTSNTRTASRLVAAALSFTGTQSSLAVHHFFQALNATVGFTGNLTTAAVHVFRTTLTATLSFTGTVVRSSLRTVAGSVGFTGAQSRRIGHLNAGTVGFTGTESVNLRRALAATISFTGTTTRRLARALTATISFAGSVSASKLVSRTFSATVGFTTQFTRRSGKFLTASVSPTSVTHTAVRTNLIATISFTVNYVITPHLLSALTGLLNRLRGREPASVLNGTEPQQPISGHRPPSAISGPEPAGRVLSGQRPATTISGEEDGT